MDMMGYETSLPSFTRIEVGADTYMQTSSGIATFFYATMALFPQAQKTAQGKLQTFIGENRILKYDDTSRPPLSYVEVLLGEVLGWRPVVPLDVGHAMISPMMMFTKAISCPKVPPYSLIYEVFSPDHFFDSNGYLNKEYVFGRRVSPGRHMAASTVWLAFTAILSTFDIKKQTDTAGIEILLSGEYTAGMISDLFPFKCSIVPSKVLRNRAFHHPSSIPKHEGQLSMTNKLQ